MIAAEHGLARSVVSDKLRRVEAHLGHTLVAFDRDRTGRLMREGRVFLAHGCEMLDVYRQLQAELEGSPPAVAAW